MKSRHSLEQYPRMLLDKYISREDQVLLGVVSSSSPTQEELDACLEVCDIEVLGGAKALTLSYVMVEHPELRFNPYTAPRLKGLISYYRFRNLRVLAHFSHIGKALNAARIPVLIFKGAAIKLLRPGLARPMADVDILVPENRMDEAVRLCRQLGYTSKNNAPPAAGMLPQAVDMLAPDGTGAVDVHHTILADHAARESFQRGVLARAVSRNAFGVRVLLPCPEDLLFIMFFHLMKDLERHTKTHSLYFALLDCQHLLRKKQDFNWNILLDNAAITETLAQFQVTAGLLNCLAPGVVPMGDLPFTRRIQVFCDRMFFGLDYFARDKKNASWHKQIRLPSQGGSHKGELSGPDRNFPCQSGASGITE